MAYFSTLLGIIAVETNGQNVIGDAGHGHGLMQIDDRSHGAWLASHANGLDPASNIDYGSSILRTNIDTFGGDLRAGVAAYNAGTTGAQRGLSDSGNPDQYTTGGNYSAKVFQRASEFRAMLGSAGGSDNGGGPAAPAQPAGPAGTSTYTVQAGDTLSGIAARFGTTWQTLAELNHLSNPNIISTGQQLLIPQGGSTGGNLEVGQYVFPVQGYTGTVELHWGTYPGASDLFAAEGTPVVAMCNGRVTAVGTEVTDQYGGNNVQYRGADGLDYYCAHGDRTPQVVEGDSLTAGQYLFGVGNTGNARTVGYHLHIGIGHGIQDGVGPTGGAGINFNAVELLRRVLAGVVTPDHPIQSGQYRVNGTGHLGLNVRDHPSVSATIVGSLVDGAVVEAENTIVEADGRVWRRVHNPDGWAADQYLAAV